MMKKNNYEVRIIQVHPKMTDEEIKGAVQQLLPHCWSDKQGFCLTIHGFDDDPRELWQIPEAMAFMRRLYSIGFISCLEVSTTCDFMLPVKSSRLPGLGALEVWLLVKNKFKLGNAELSKTVISQFFKDLEKSNFKAESICKEKKYHYDLKMIEGNLKKTKSIPDAPIRHGGFRI